MSIFENALLRSGLWVAEQLKHRNNNPDLARRPSPPKPRSQKRRALSLPPTSDFLNAQHFQSQSPFFSVLPPEIRAYIFALVLGNRHLLLTLTDDRRILRTAISHGYELMKCPHPLALPLSCRRAYTESLLFLYTHSTFHTFNPDVITHLPSSLLPQRLASIRNLHFTWYLTEAPRLSFSSSFSTRQSQPTLALARSQAQHIKRRLRLVLKQQRERHLNRAWKDVWSCMAKMEGLKVLVVRLDVPLGWETGWKTREAELLGSVREVGTGMRVGASSSRWEALERFEVVLNWPAPVGKGEAEEEGRSDGWPFRVVRREREHWANWDW